MAATEQPVRVRWSLGPWSAGLTRSRPQGHHADQLVDIPATGLPHRLQNSSSQRLKMLGTWLDACGVCSAHSSFCTWCKISMPLVLQAVHVPPRLKQHEQEHSVHDAAEEHQLQHLSISSPVDDGCQPSTDRASCGSAATEELMCCQAATAVIRLPPSEELQAVTVSRGFI